MGTDNTPRNPQILRFVGLSIVCAALPLLAGCDKTKDVTYNSAYGNFSAVATTWKLKSELRLVEVNNTLYVLVPGPLVDTDARNIALLPIGTQIRIEHLTFQSTFETTYLYATGTLL